MKLVIHNKEPKYQLKRGMHVTADFQYVHNYGCMRELKKQGEHCFGVVWQDADYYDITVIIDEDQGIRNEI